MAPRPVVSLRYRPGRSGSGSGPALADRQNFLGNKQSSNFCSQSNKLLILSYQILVSPKRIHVAGTTGHTQPPEKIAKKPANEIAIPV
jgi:hypothetical protein